MKHTPVIFLMFSIVLTSIAIISFASFYGSDWTWIGQQLALFTMLFIVLGLAFYTLSGWLRR